MRTRLGRAGAPAVLALLLPAALALCDGRARASGAEPRIPGLEPEEVRALLQGEGMGQARVADVQGYPGPRHVLQAWTAGRLPLSDAQLTRIQAIAGAMDAEAHRLGRLVLDAEEELALAFGAGRIDVTDLEARVGRIAALRGALRTAHLRAHLATRAALDRAQLARYAEYRGAPAGAGAPHSGHGHP
jgi:hypothetical protein